MTFTRIAAFLLIVIFFNYKTALAQPRQCKTCEVRDFETNQACLCPDDQFCLTNGIKRCQKCNNCYDSWKNTTKERRNDIENILEEIVKKYAVDLPELQKLLDTLRKTVERTENEFNKLNLLGTQTQSKITTVQKNLKKLQEDIDRVRELLKQIGIPQSIQDLLRYLKTVKQLVRDVVNELKLLKFDASGVDLQLIAKIGTIRQDLNDMLKKIPSLEKNSLNLALSLENDIDLLESILSGDNSTAQFPQNLNASSQWIEEELLWLFNLINNYQNASIDVEGLSKNASNVRSAAESNDKILEDLLKKHENFKKELDELKSEVRFYNATDQIRKQLQDLVIRIEEFKKLKKILRQKKRLLRELKQFHKELEEFEAIIKEVQQYEKQWNKLLHEQTELLIKFQAFGDLKPVSEIIEDIEKMTREAEAIKKQLANHCTATKAPK